MNSKTFAHTLFSTLYFMPVNSYCFQVLSCYILFDIFVTASQTDMTVNV